MTQSKEESVADRLLRSAREAAAIEKGELNPARVSRHLTAATAEVIPPPTFDAARIRDIRDRMELSQPVFAAALNVSPETVRAWEQGKREPEGPTLRLLEVAERSPGLFLDRVRERAAR